MTLLAQLPATTPIKLPNRPAPLFSTRCSDSTQQTLYTRTIAKPPLPIHNPEGPCASSAPRSRTSYEPYTEVQKLELRGTVLDFLTRTDARRNDDVDPLELPSLRHIREVLFQCRDLYQAKPGPGQAGGAANSTRSSATVP